MFTAGFEKTALSVPSPGAAIGALKGTARSATKAVKGAVEKFKGREYEKGVQAFRKATTGKARETGTSLYGARARKLQAKGKAPSFEEAEQMARKSKADVYKRKATMAESKKAREPSFARKHPFLTAGGLYLAGRAAFGGGDEDKQTSPQPQVYQPNY